MKNLKIVILIVGLIFGIRVDAGEKIYFISNDHLATPQQVTDGLQNVVWEAGTDAFGNSTPGIAIENNDIRFPGQYYDSETGLHYNWNRYYDPQTGRYVTSDPIGLDGGLNTFGYAAQNPFIYSDPDGLQFQGGFSGFRFLGNLSGERAISDAVQMDFPDGTPTARGVAKATGQCLTCVATCLVIGQAVPVGMDIAEHASKVAKAALANGVKAALGMFSTMTDIECSVRCF